MIPPIYILVTVAFPDVRSRARYFGVVSGAGGLGAAAGPLIGGVVTSAISWRASFGLQVLVVAWIILPTRKITDPAPAGPRPRFDVTGAVLSAAGLFFVVLGLLQSRTYGFGASRQDFSIGSTVVIPKGSISPVWIFVAIGALFLLWFFLYTRSAEQKGKEVLLLALVRAHSGVWTWIPGLFLFGAGVGVMLTSSVNVVQSSFPEADQGEISGLSRSVSNLGSSLGTALVGSVLVAVKLPEGKPRAVALTMMLVFTLIGLVLGILIPRTAAGAAAAETPGTGSPRRQPAS
jgi:hypothetical protein